MQTQVLATQQSLATIGYALGRTRGQWAKLGSGFNGVIRAIAADVDGRIYFGGDFTTANGVTVNYVCYWNGTTFVALGAGPGLNGVVRALAVGPDGRTLYIGGDFTDVSGGAGGTYNRIIKWTGSSFEALGTGMSGSAYALFVSSNGRVYVGGKFATGDGVTLNNIGYWNGTTFVAMDSGAGTGGTHYVYAIVEDADGTIWLGGDFTQIGSGPDDALKIAAWETDDTWWLVTPNEEGFNNTVRALLALKDGSVIAGGDFTENGSGTPTITYNYWARFRGYSWGVLDTGLNGAVWSLAWDPELGILIGGDFTQAGSDFPTADYIVAYPGASFEHIDVDLPADFTVQAIAVYKGDLYLGGDQTGTATSAEATTVTNSGSAPAKCKFIFKRSGGTSATIESIKNVTAGKKIIVKYDLADGETITIDETGLVSDVYGRQNGALSPNSDLADFRLRPGSNKMTCFVSTSGSPTVSAWIQWNNTRLGVV